MKPRWTNYVALILLPFGAGFAGIGWLVGVAALWESPGWTRKERIIGTLVPPGGLGLAVLVFLFAGPPSCNDVAERVPDCNEGGLDVVAIDALVVFLALVAIVVPIWLGLQLWRRRATT